MSLTEPTKSTREFLAKREETCKQLRAFLKQTGCTTPSRKRHEQRPFAKRAHPLGA